MSVRLRDNGKMIRRFVYLFLEQLMDGFIVGVRFFGIVKLVQHPLFLMTTYKVKGVNRGVGLIHYLL
jgi:hypothetical protein